MTRAVEESNRRMLRVRDAMDRDWAKPLDIPALARIAHVSEAHFIRVFRATFGETPHRYLQRRRVERAMFLLRETDRSVTEICFDVAARWGLAVCMAVLLLGAASAAVGLSRASPAKR